MLEKKLGKKVDITVKTGSNDSALYELAEIISSTDYLLEIKTICGTVMIIGINSIETIIPAAYG